jgi:hypothetical protein
MRTPRAIPPEAGNSNEGASVHRSKVCREWNPASGFSHPRRSISMTLVSFSCSEWSVRSGQMVCCWTARVTHHFEILNCRHCGVCAHVNRAHKTRCHCIIEVIVEFSISFRLVCQHGCRRTMFAWQSPESPTSTVALIKIDAFMMANTVLGWVWKY